MRRTALLVPALFAACAAPTYDYGPYLAHMPRSILVLPPLNDSPEVSATYGWLSTVTRPLAEAGYYVYPVAVVDELLRQNGMPTAGEMHTVPLDKVREIIGADAVLYTRIQEWGTSYQIINSQTRVLIECSMVDVESGTEIWHVSREAVYNSSSSGGGGGIGGLIVNMVTAVVDQVASDLSDYSADMGAMVNNGLATGYNGMLIGPYHPRYAEDQKLRRDELAAQQAEAAADDGQ